MKDRGDSPRSKALKFRNFLLSLPPAADRFFTIYIKNAGYQSDPYMVLATKLTNYNLSIIIRIQIYQNLVVAYKIKV
jgi:hypothetical protein